MKDCDMVIGTRTTRQMIEQGSNFETAKVYINLCNGKTDRTFYGGTRSHVLQMLIVVIWQSGKRSVHNRIKPSLEVQGKLTLLR